jgi:hypothetical protein
MPSSSGRAYEHMTPSLALDRVMEPAEVIGWLVRVAPARHTGLMAANRTWRQPCIQSHRLT